MINNICIYGAGGVGGFFGGQLAYYSQSHPDFPRIHFIARGEHLARIKESGLTLKIGDQSLQCVPESATEYFSELPPCEMIIIAVKSYDLTSVMESLDPVLEKETIILPLLNGVDIYERIRTVTQKATVLPACVYVGTHIEKAGVVSQKGGEGKIILGKDPLHENIDPQAVLDLFEKAGISYEWKDNPYPAVWSKYMFIAAYGLVTASHQKSVGEVYHDPELRNMTIKVMEEIRGISQKQHVELPPNIIELSIHKAQDFPFETRTSFQRDVETWGKRHEGELFGKTILRLGEKLKVDTSMTQKMYQKIRP